MALFVKDDRADRPEEANLATRASSPQPAAARDAQAQLGKGTKIEGVLTFKGSVRIEGEIEGEIRADDTVTLGESARVTAKITAGTVIMQGTVTGDIIAKKRVELRAPATVVGNISTPSLVIHEGVVFEGRCAMGDTAATKTEGDKRVAIFPTEERGNGTLPKSEAAN
jgi:cytoskeletal protein CcmA (bactofilin family)